MLRVLDKSWFRLHQPLLLAIANTREGRALLGIDERLPQIKMLTPSSLTVTLEGNKYLSHFYPVNKYARAIDRNLIEIADYSRAFRYVPFIAGGETTTYKPDAHTEVTSVDGDCSQIGVNVTFASLVGGGGSAHTDGSGLRSFIAIRADTTPNRYKELRRAFYLYDTSSLADNASIQSARHGVIVTATGLKDLNNGVHDSSRYVLTSSNPAEDTNLNDGDFDSVGSISFGEGVRQLELVGGSYNYINLNSSGRNNISKTGVSKFAMRYKWDFLNSTSGLTWISNGSQSVNAYFADEGNNREPILEVTWIIGIQAAGNLRVDADLSGSAFRVWEGTGVLETTALLIGNAVVPEFADAEGALTLSADLTAGGTTWVKAAGQLTTSGKLIVTGGSVVIDARGSLGMSASLEQEDFAGHQINLKGSV